MRRPLSIRRGAEALSPIHRGTVLVVEDDAAVREVLRRALERAGCDVLAAANGHEALTVSDRHPGAIDVLVTDVVMPLMGGPQLALKLKGKRPQIQVLYMSGYPPEVLRRHGVRGSGREFMAKPLSCAELVARVSDALAATTDRYGRAVGSVARFANRAALRRHSLVWEAADA